VKTTRVLWTKAASPEFLRLHARKIGK